VSPLTRYVLFQLPGTALVGVLMLAFWEETALPGWAGVLFFVAWIAKDAMLYPMLKRAYEPGEPSDARRLVGSRGVARDELNPRGQVQVRGEIWRAQAIEGAEPIPSGTDVVVRGADRFTLLVDRAP
jgi:membrane-bound serine protease (ClpP class)